MFFGIRGPGGIGTASGSTHGAATGAPFEEAIRLASFADSLPKRSIAARSSRSKRF
jgi:hypothetical protein